MWAASHCPGPACRPRPSGSRALGTTPEAPRQPEKHVSFLSASCFLTGGPEDDPELRRERVHGGLTFPGRLGRGSPGQDLPWASPASSLQASLTQGSDGATHPAPYSSMFFAPFHGHSIDRTKSWGQNGGRPAGSASGVDVDLDAAPCWGWSATAPVQKAAGGSARGGTRGVRGWRGAE